MAESGVSDVSDVYHRTRVMLNSAVYGWSLLLGSVIGCIAGVSGANGYARRLTLFIPLFPPLTFRSLRYWPRHHRLRPSLLPHDVSHRGARDHPPTKSLKCRRVMGKLMLIRCLDINRRSQDSYYILGSVIASWVIFGTSYLTSSWGWVSEFGRTMTDLSEDPIYPTSPSRSVHPHRRTIRPRDASLPPV